MLLLLILHLLYDLFSVKKELENIKHRGKTTKIEFPFHDEGKIPNCHSFFCFFKSSLKLFSSPQKTTFC